MRAPDDPLHDGSSHPTADPTAADAYHGPGWCEPRSVTSTEAGEALPSLHGPRQESACPTVSAVGLFHRRPRWSMTSSRRNARGRSRRATVSCHERQRTSVGRRPATAARDLRAAPRDAIPAPAPATDVARRAGEAVAAALVIVPERLSDVYYRTGLTILLTIITLGIWGFLWTYRTSEDLKKYNGDGLGGVLGIVIYLLISVVLMFTIPNEIKNMYERDGRPSPITAVWGLWFLLPLSETLSGMSRCSGC